MQSAEQQGTSSTLQSRCRACSDKYFVFGEMLSLRDTDQSGHLFVTQTPGACIAGPVLEAGIQ